MSSYPRASTNEAEKHRHSKQDALCDRQPPIPTPIISPESGLYGQTLSSSRVALFRKIRGHASKGCNNATLSIYFSCKIAPHTAIFIFSPCSFSLVKSITTKHITPFQSSLPGMAHTLLFYLQSEGKRAMPPTLNVRKGQWANAGIQAHIRTCAVTSAGTVTGSGLNPLQNMQPGLCLLPAWTNPKQNDRSEGICAHWGSAR